MCLYHHFCQVLKSSNPPSSLSADESTSPTPISDGEEIQYQDAVRIDFRGRWAPTFEQDMQDDSVVFQEVSQCWIMVGDKSVVPALEMGIRFLKVGESALIWSHSKYAMGQHMRTIPTQSTSSLDKNNHSNATCIPPESNVLYEVTVHECIPNLDISPDLTVQIGQCQKEMANDVYTHEWTDGLALPRVKYLYTKCAQLMENLLLQEEVNDALSTSDWHERAWLLRLDCLHNLVALYLRAQQYAAAKAAAVNALQLDPHHGKTLVRAAKAALYDPASSFEEVQAALEAAREVIPTSVAPNDSSPPQDALAHDLQKLQAEFQRRHAEYRKKTKAMFSKMTTAISTPSTTTTPSSTTPPTPTPESNHNETDHSSDELPPLDSITTESLSSASAPDSSSTDTSTREASTNKDSVSTPQESSTATHSNSSTLGLNWLWLAPVVQLLLAGVLIYFLAPYSFPMTRHDEI
jgi:hypothetical protein